MKHVNYFKVETDKHRTPMARRQQAWDWLRKMKRQRNIIHNPKGLRSEFIEDALAIGLFTRKKQHPHLVDKGRPVPKHGSGPS